MEKVWKFLSSMKFAIILLAVLAAACAGGSFITQGQSYSWYAATYGEKTAGLIIALGLEDVFHCWWFYGLTALLCINLLMCNILRMPTLVRQANKAFTAESKKGVRGAVNVSFPKKTEEIFGKLGFRKIESSKTGEGKEFLYASRNKIGIWGAWICHLGILILIIGFTLGQVLQEGYTVYGVPGQSKPVGDTDLVFTVDDFEVGLRDDDTVSQYTTNFTVRNVTTGNKAGAEISVNHPAKIEGMSWYQNSMGWAADMHVVKDGEEIQTETICQGETVNIEDKDGLSLGLVGFYPDYVRGSNGMPATASDKLNNPGYLYRAVYMGQTLGMNVLYGEEEDTAVLTIDEYTITFTDPQYYTLVQVKRDPYTPIAFVGGLLVFLGLILALYIQPKELWAQMADGKWIVSGKSRKGGELYRQAILEAAAELGGTAEPESKPAKEKEIREEIKEDIKKEGDENK